MNTEISNSDYALALALWKTNTALYQSSSLSRGVMSALLDVLLGKQDEAFDRLRALVVDLNGIEKSIGESQDQINQLLGMPDAG